MRGDSQRFRVLVTEIVRGGAPARALGPRLLELSMLLRRQAGARVVADGRAGTSTTDGLAIGLRAAASCAEDQTRTVAFLRGATLAVEAALALAPDRPVHLLEAGCGPIALLAAPLAAMFGPERLQLTLVEIHPDAVACAATLLDALELTSCVRALTCADATALDIPGPVDIVLTETMTEALEEEPQVAITRHLLRAHPDALLVPQEIGVDLVLLNRMAELGRSWPTVAKRVVLGRVFTLNAETSRQPADADGALAGALLDIPREIPAGFDLHYATTVTVFGDQVLSDYDCLITQPRPVAGAASIRPGDTLQFRYQLGAYPQLVWSRV